MDKRRICFVITSSIHYARNKKILENLRDNPDVDLKIVIGASAILPNYGNVISLMERDGFSYDEIIYMTIEGGNTVAMSKTTGMGIIEFSTVFDNIKPDIVVVRGDRYEVLAAAVAAAYLNIMVAHIEGGDVSGNIDESVRHAITKLSHIHFTTNNESKNRLLLMGEDPKYVFNFGSPDVEILDHHDDIFNLASINNLGVGGNIDLSRKYIIVMYHPVTSELSENRHHVDSLLKIINNLSIPTIWFWPNVDAGTDEISKGIRVFRENNKPSNIRFLKYLPPDDFISLLKNSAVLVGNSSAGIKESSYLGIPVVNIGNRQNNRLKGMNVIDVGDDAEQIARAIISQYEHGHYPSSDIYYKKNTSKLISDTLTSITVYKQKRFHDNFNLVKTGSQSISHSEAINQTNQFSKPRVLGLITARKGSKGIIGKNMKELNGKPLAAYTFEAVKHSSLLDDCIVSSDDIDLLELAKSHNIRVPFVRPEMLAMDHSKSIDVVNHALDWLETYEYKKFDYVMILQPTSPLRTGFDIDESIRIAFKNNADSVMSMVELEDFGIEKLKVIDGGKIKPWLAPEDKISSSRQTANRIYKRNCAIYLTKVEYLRAGDLFGQHSLPYIMPLSRSVDINNLEDFKLAESLIKNTENENNN